MNHRCCAKKQGALRFALCERPPTGPTSGLSRVCRGINRNPRLKSETSATHFLSPLTNSMRQTSSCVLGHKGPPEAQRLLQNANASFSPGRSVQPHMHEAQRA